MSDALFDVSDRTVIITGASSGIGLHLCGTFVKRGARVIALSRSAGSSEELARLAEESGQRLHAHSLDVSDARSTETVLDELIARYPRIDVLINNAAMTSEQTMLACDDDEWERTLAVNLTGPMRLSSRVASVMLASAVRGSIINVLSIAAFRTVRRLGAYSVSKAGLAQLTRTMALELAPHGIRVNGLVPGYVKTAMNTEYLSGPGGSRTVAKIPLGRVGDLADLDGAAVFLASSASAYMTGSFLVVDGGYLL